MVEPVFGLNVGYVARTMKNFGLAHLYVVGRKSVPRSAKRFASHGGDIVKGASYVSLLELRKRFPLLIGTTAVVGGKSRNPARKTISVPNLARLGFDPSDAVIVLGRDTTGLTAEELEECDVVVHIRTGTTYPTLNISHALAIILYELSSAEPGVVRRTDRMYSDGLLKYFAKMLSLGGYPERKRKIAVRILGQAVTRSGISEEETIALMGAFRKVNLALEKRSQEPIYF